MRTHMESGHGEPASKRRPRFVIETPEDYALVHHRMNALRSAALTEEARAEIRALQIAVHDWDHGLITGHGGKGVRHASR